MAPVSTSVNPSLRASSLETVDLPAPAGPSMATMRGRGGTLQHLFEGGEETLILGRQPDRDSQRVGKAVVGDGPGDHPPLQERVGEGPRRASKISEDEV